MIVCPNCNHQNPDAAVQCEACYTPLPAMMTCPNCGASIQADASFCGQCGFNLQGAAIAQSSSKSANPFSATASPNLDLPDLPPPDPLVEPEPLPVNLPPTAIKASNPKASTSQASMQQASASENSEAGSPQPAENPFAPAPDLPAPDSPVPDSTMAQVSAGTPASAAYRTQLQTQVARLLHVQTNTTVELPATLAVIHLGKPNDRIPPDVDVSGFPNSEIVSRIHADIRVEGDIYYLEDVGSSNGTYVNNSPLPSGNRHRLRPGDRIALGKGDKVTFLFQIS